MHRAGKTAERIREAIQTIPLGEPFTSARFLGFGTRAAVDHALSRFTKTGVIQRVARGIFVKPRTSKYVGSLLPGPKAIAEAVALQTGARVQMNGAEAALELRLSTQAPVTPVYYTSGPTRRFRVGATEITLKHVTSRKLALAGTPAGTALTALWYLGKSQVTESIIEQVRQRLPSKEFEALKSATSSMPAWMADVLHRYDRRLQNG